MTKPNWINGKPPAGSYVGMGVCSGLQGLPTRSAEMRAMASIVQAVCDPEASGQARGQVFGSRTIDTYVEPCGNGKTQSYALMSALNVRCENGNTYSWNDGKSVWEKMATPRAKTAARAPHKKSSGSPITKQGQAKPPQPSNKIPPKKDF